MELASIAAAVEPAAVRQHQDSPRDRLKRVFRTSCDGIYRFLYVRVGGDRHVAEDLLQQTCAVAAGHRRMPDMDQDCEAWMYGIAKNLIRKHWRTIKKLKNHVRLQDVETSKKLIERLTTRSLPTRELIQEESFTRLMLAITSLSTVDQRLIFNFYFDSQPHAQIAQELDTTTKSVETKLYRIRKRLRAILENDE